MGRHKNSENEEEFTVQDEEEVIPTVEDNQAEIISDAKNKEAQKVSEKDKVIEEKQESDEEQDKEALAKQLEAKRQELESQ